MTEGAGEQAPTYQALILDLRQVRSAGAGRIRSLSVPALRQAAVLLDYGDAGTDEPAPVRDLLRRVVAGLGGGNEQDEAEYLLGIMAGTSLWASGQRLTKAAEIRRISTEAYRKKPLDDLLALLAEGILDLLHENGMRHARIEMEQRRHPANSRLAVQWVERFEAYYAVWTPAYALAADLQAALECYTDEPADHVPWDPQSEEAYDPLAQARGYGRSALYWYAAFQMELRRFRTAHGGMWLASSLEIEDEISDAIYRIGWHNDINDEDDSWLRRQLADSRREENDHFTDLILAFPRGVKIHGQWQAFILAGVGLSEKEQSDSQVWSTMRACQDYCRLIDEDWQRIADWYRPGVRPRRHTTGEALYETQISKGRASSEASKGKT